MSEIYKIKTGDNLSKIAQEFNTTVDKIVSDNNITDANKIFVGDVITIDLDNEVKKEEKPKQEVLSVEPSNVTHTSSDNSNVKIEKEVGEAYQLKASYTGNLNSKRSASDASRSSNGVLTYENKKYTVGDRTEGNTLSNSDYLYLVGQVAGEAGSDNDDMLGVCSTILNRVESGDGNVEQVLANAYWPWGKTCNKFVNYDANGNIVGLKSAEQLSPGDYEKLQRVITVVDDAMNGVRNVNSATRFYSGDGTHNYFSDSYK